MEMYEHFLIVLMKSGYIPRTVEQFLSGKAKDDPFVVILRHDIDRRINNASKFSQLEFSLGIVATYYFRYPYTFVPDIIHSVAGQGHEIGYHYEVMSKAVGNRTVANNLFIKELKEFRSIYPVTTVCMHGAPLSNYDNREFWCSHQFIEFGLLGEAYLSMKDIYYFSDTGRTWSPENKIRDQISGNLNQSDNVYGTRDLMGFIEKTKPRFLYILTHPERWAQSSWELALFWTIDQGVNLGKKVIGFLK